MCSEKYYRPDTGERQIRNARLIPTHGGYRNLRSFRTAQLVYDGTVIFCDRFIERRSRTHDQMVQAARSGVQNIAEGSMASATSKKQNSSSQALRVQDLKSFCWTIRIF